MSELTTAWLAIWRTCWAGVSRTVPVLRTVATRSRGACSRWPLDTLNLQARSSRTSMSTTKCWSNFGCPGQGLSLQVVFLDVFASSSSRKIRQHNGTSRRALSIRETQQLDPTCAREKAHTMGYSGRRAEFRYDRRRLLFDNNTCGADWASWEESALKSTVTMDDDVHRLKKKTKNENHYRWHGLRSHSDKYWVRHADMPRLHIAYHNVTGWPASRQANIFMKIELNLIKNRTFNRSASCTGERL